MGKMGSDLICPTHWFTMSLDGFRDMTMADDEIRTSFSNHLDPSAPIPRRYLAYLRQDYLGNYEEVKRVII